MGIIGVEARQPGYNLARCFEFLNQVWTVILDGEWLYLRLAISRKPALFNTVIWNSPPDCEPGKVSSGPMRNNCEE